MTCTNFLGCPAKGMERVPCGMTTCTPASEMATQMLFFSAATAKALTTFLAGFAFTTTTLPNITLACLRRRLRLHLQHGKARDRELACRFDFLRGNCREARKHLLAVCRFQACGCGNRCCDSGLPC